jgi:hypothetical protein
MSQPEQVTGRLTVTPTFEQYIDLLLLMIPVYENAGLSVYFDTRKQRLSLLFSSQDSSASSQAMIRLRSTNLEEHTALLKSYLTTGPGCLLDSVLVGVVLL